MRLTVLALTMATALSAQTGWNDPEKIAAHNIKIITVESCRREFGKPDSCTIDVINTYDRQGRLIETVSQPNKTSRYQGTYTYNENGQRIKVQHISMSDTTVTTDEYDGNGRKVKSVTSKNGQISSVTTLKYDGTKISSSIIKNERGEIIGESRYTYDQSGKLSTSLWTNLSSDHKSISHYNQQGQRLVDSVMNFAGVLNAVHTYAYKNDTISLKRSYNLKGFVSETRYTYDSLQRIIRYEVVDSVNRYNSYFTDYTYDSSGNLIETIDTRRGSQLSRRYTYDNGGKLISETNSSAPERVITSYTYSEKGELLTLTDPEHPRDEITNEYDANGWKVKMRVTQGGLTRSSTFTYDNKGHLINEKKFFQVKPDSMLLYYEIDYHNDDEGKHIEAVHKSYLLRNMVYHLALKNDSVPPSIFTMVYAYDERDSLISVTGLTGKKEQTVGEQSIKYSYGKNGKVQQIEYYYPGTDKLKGRVVHEYDDSNRVILTNYYYDSDTLPDRTHRYYYDSNNRVSHTCEYNKWGELVEHTFNVYDQSGQLLKVVDGGKGTSYRKYSYETYPRK